MIKCFNHFWKTGGSAPNRLLNKGREAVPPPPDDLNAGIQAQLDLLRRQVSRGADRPLSTPGYVSSSEHRDTRELTPPPSYHPESGPRAERAIEMQNFLPPEDVKKLQQSQDHLYEHAMNPAFIQYVRATGNEGTVFAALDLLFKHPYDFEYITKPNERVEIRKRRPLDKSSTEIDNAFLLVLETKEGYITDVTLNAQKSAHLKQAGSDEIPWVSNPQYNQSMPQYRERYKNERKRYENDRTAELLRKIPNFDKLSPPDQEAARRKAKKKAKKESWQYVSPEMQTVFELENIAFPKRFLAMIESRNLLLDGGPPPIHEKDDPRIKDLTEQMSHQGATYQEITQDKANKWYVMVMADPEQEGVYMIATRSYYIEGNPLYDQEPLRVSKEGYVMRDNGDKASPRWTRDPRYVQNLRRRYYKENPEATKTLTPADVQELQAVDSGIQTKQGELTQVTENQKKKQEALDKRAKIDEAFERADLNKLAQVAHAVSPTEFYPAIDKLVKKKDKKKLIIGIKRALNDDDDVGSRHNKAAELLGVG